MSLIVRWIALLAAASLAGPPAFADAPYIAPADDEQYFGAPEELLTWTPEQQVAGFRNVDRLFPTRTIEAGDTPSALPYATRDLGEVVLTVNEESMTVDEYFVRQSVAGLLVIKDGNIVYERYGLGNDENSRWVSFSVSKSVVAMLFGAAIKDGYIKSVDETVTDYLPRMKDSSYDEASIRNLLQMASGVEWNENYADPESDISQATWPTVELFEYMRDKPRVAEPGERFNYNTAETNLAGTLLRSAIGNNLSIYLSEKIWKPFGMESDASWMLTEAGGGEFGGCCINATLRDYGRLGLFAMANGQLADGTAVLPADWMQDSTAPSKGYAGYGYFWWLDGGDSYGASGIHGQGIHINPDANLVIAIHSARADASNDSDWAWQAALNAAISQALSD